MLAVTATGSAQSTYVPGSGQSESGKLAQQMREMRDQQSRVVAETVERQAEFSGNRAEALQRQAEQMQNRVDQVEADKGLGSRIDISV